MTQRVTNCVSDNLTVTNLVEEINLIYAHVCMSIINHYTQFYIMHEFSE